jgi:hypothetical protein
MSHSKSHDVSLMTIGRATFETKPTLTIHPATHRGTDTTLKKRAFEATELLGRDPPHCAQEHVRERLFRWRLSPNFAKVSENFGHGNRKIPEESRGLKTIQSDLNHA